MLSRFSDRWSNKSKHCIYIRKDAQLYTELRIVSNDGGAYEAVFIKAKWWSVMLLMSQWPNLLFSEGKDQVEIVQLEHSTKQLCVYLICLKKLHPDLLRYCCAIQLKHRHLLQTVLCGTWQTPPEASFERGYLVCSLSYFLSASLSGLASLWKYSSLTLPPPLSLSFSRLSWHHHQHRVSIAVGSNYVCVINIINTPLWSTFLNTWSNEMGISSRISWARWSTPEH